MKVVESIFFTNLGNIEIFEGIMKKTLLILSAVIALSACTSNGSVSNYAIGDDSAAIKAGRNRAEAQLSRAELEQHRRQRTNVSEELALEREKRANKHDAVREGMGTAAGGLGLLNGVLGTVSHIKAVF